MLKKTTYIFSLAAIVFFLLLASCKKPSNEPITTFYLVRHAEKAVDGTDDPDLSDLGQQRAVKIASMFGNQKVQKLYATSYKRTQQTLQPLADSLNLQILIYDHRDPASIEKMIQDCRGKIALVAGHSNSIPKLANVLIGEEVYQELDESVYTKMWEITKKGDTIIGHKIM